VTTSGRKQLTIGSVDLAYNDEGAGAPPLLLLHGYTGAASDFADVTPPLAASRRVVAYDQRGHGDSTNTGDAATYTFHQLTDDLTGFVDALDLAPIDLLGHSMGGIIAMRYVLAHPERVRPERCPSRSATGW
jgi:pimeloyl-ACP methyl ester carboxylesterase